jgi:fatty acid desaturase
VLRFPVLGWLVRDAIHGLPDAKYYFFANCALLLVAAIYTFGYPLVIVLALTLAAFALVMLVHMTAADTFSKANRKALAEEKLRRRLRPI